MVSAFPDTSSHCYRFQSSISAERHIITLKMTTTRIPTAAAEEEDVYRDLLEQLINTAAFVNGFPTTDFAARLHYKATRTQRTNEFQSHGFLDMGRPWPSTDPHPASKILAALDCNSDLTWLAEITFADAIKEVDSRFSSRVDSVHPPNGHSFSH